MKLRHILCALLIVIPSVWSESEVTPGVTQYLPGDLPEDLPETGMITLSPGGVWVRKGEWDGKVVYQFFVIAPDRPKEEQPPEFAMFSKFYCSFCLTLDELRSIAQTFEKNADKNEWAIGNRFPSRLYLARKGERWTLYHRNAPVRFQNTKAEPKSKDIPLANFSHEDLRLMVALLEDAKAEVVPPR